jgi:hypothetical protein
MQAVVQPQADPATRSNQPTAIDLLAAGLLVGTVLLHIVAMFPHYFGGSGGASLWSQPDQAAEYTVLAAGWALALAIGISSPSRTGLAAGLAVGVAATEFGFRLSDLGYVFRYGSGQAGPGLWLMIAAWVVGAAGAGAAVIAARRRGVLAEPAIAPAVDPDVAISVGEAPSVPGSVTGPAEVVPYVPASDAAWPAHPGPATGHGEGWPAPGVWAPAAPTPGSHFEPDSAASPWAPAPVESPAMAGPVEPGPVEPGPVEPGPVEPGPVQSGPVQSGPVQSGPVQSGMVESGLVESGPVNSPLATGPAGAPAAAAPATSPAVHDAASGESAQPPGPESRAAAAASAQPPAPGDDISAGVEPPATTAPPPGRAGRSAGYGPIAVAVVAVLAAATAGAFLPAWDHYSGIETTTGRAVSINAGNAFSGPWQVVLGTLLAALALLALPVLATRLRARAVGAVVVAGSLIVLASQFIAAIVQVDEPIPSSIITPGEANELGLQLHLTLTGWFTVDVLAAFALFAVTMVLGHIRRVEMPSELHASSPGTWPSAPDARRAASLPSA